jgi:hypothetical protein
MPTPTEVRVLTTQLAEERNADDWRRRTIERDVPVSVIQQNFAAFLQVLHAVFFQNVPEKEDLLLDEVHVSAQMDAGGAFRLVSGDAASHGGGVTMILRRRRKELTADVSELHLNTPHEPLNHAGPTDRRPIQIVGPDELAIPLAGPGQSRIPVDLSGTVNPAPGPLTVNVV